MWSFLKSQKGVSMVEGLVAFGIMGGAGLFVMNTMSQSSEAEKDVNIRQMLLKTRTSFIQTLRSPDAISNIAKENNYRCLEENRNCTARDYTKISVMDGNGIQLTDRSNSSGLGFNLAGKTCTNFPSASCPFKYSISLKTVCYDSDCLVPQFKFQANLTAHKNSKNFNLKNYEFEITAGQAIDSYERSCVSLGGTYQPGSQGVSPSCILSLEGDCPKSDGKFQAVIGFNKTTKQKICRPILKDFFNGQTCDAGVTCDADNPGGTPGEKMMGFDNKGDIICVKQELNPGCAQLCDSSPKCMPITNCQTDPTLPGCTPVSLPPASPSIDFSSIGDGCGDGGC